MLCSLTRIDSNLLSEVKVNSTSVADVGPNPTPVRY